MLSDGLLLGLLSCLIHHRLRSFSNGKFSRWNVQRKLAADCSGVGLEMERSFKWISNVIDPARLWECIVPVCRALSLLVATSGPHRMTAQ
eukprot:m.1076926 g.1076926  ORF g.1076926 m.1076926 type:complete len:90 (-) comp24249_c0_seq11:3053-3322(-)